MKRNQRLLVVILLTIGWMMLIFSFSDQTGEESSGLSAFIAKPVTDMIAAWQGVEVNEELYLRVDGIIRMTAHFCEYAILGGLLMLAISHFGLVCTWLPWLIGTAYALTDEWHQSFSDGRVCDLMDVVIDAGGVLCGILLVKLMIKIWRKSHVQNQ